MLPKVTLLSGEGTTFALKFGTKLFEFKGGVALSVPPAVALAVEKRLDREGNPLFAVAGLPTIVETAKNPKDAQQSIKSPRQLQFAL